MLTRSFCVLALVAWSIHTQQTQQIKVKDPLPGGRVRRGVGEREEKNEWDGVIRAEGGAKPLDR